MVGEGDNGGRSGGACRKHCVAGIRVCSRRPEGISWKQLMSWSRHSSTSPDVGLRLRIGLSGRSGGSLWAEKARKFVTGRAWRVQPVAKRCRGRTKVEERAEIRVCMRVCVKCGEMTGVSATMVEVRSKTQAGSGRKGPGERVRERREVSDRGEE